MAVEVAQRFLLVLQAILSHSTILIRKDSAGSCKYVGFLALEHNSCHILIEKVLRRSRLTYILTTRVRVGPYPDSELHHTARMV